MSHHCNLCTALGSEGLPEIASQEQILAHAEIHRQQVKYYDSLDDDIKEENNGVFNQNWNEDYQIKIKMETIDDHSSAIQKRKIPRITPIAANCRKLFSSIRRIPDMKLECGECGQILRLINTNNSINSTSFRRHAIGHLQKPMFNCNHCQYRSNTKGYMISHIQQLHRLSGKEHYKDLTVNHEEEIFKKIKDCFGQKDRLETPSTTKQTTLLHRYMTTLYRAKWMNQARIRCNKCVLHLLVRKPNRFNPSIPINHACIHLGKLLFSCRHCNRRSATATAMMLHLKKAHYLGAYQENFVSSVLANREEIIEMIEQCYGLVDPAQESVPAETMRSKHNIVCENKIRSLAGENKLFADRRIHSRRLITKFSKSGIITCRICSHQLNVKQASNQKAICHASTHVEKPLYKCRHCQKDIHVMSSVYRHMKKEHNITKNVTKEFDDFSDHLHKEIMDALTRSFDWSGSSQSKDDEPDSDGSHSFDYVCALAELAN